MSPSNTTARTTADGIMDGSCFNTSSGNKFNPLAPEAYPFKLEDCARALSNTCRFGGHIEHFYSVAEHAVRVSKLVADWGGTLENQFWGLHHDDAEGMGLGDLIRPVKHHESMQMYRDAEHRLQLHLVNSLAKTCLNERWSLGQPAIVQDADYYMCHVEARDLQATLSPWVEVYAVRGYPAITSPLQPNKSLRLFLDTHSQLVRKFKERSR